MDNVEELYNQKSHIETEAEEYMVPVTEQYIW